MAFLLLSFYQNMSEVDLSEYVPSKSWEVVRTSAILDQGIYACCPEPYPHILFSITLRRFPSFHIFVLLLPSVLLSLLIPVTFYMPVQGPDRSNFGKIQYNHNV